MQAERLRLGPAPLIAIAVSFLLMGMVVAAYGPLLEHLTRRFGVSLPVAGATISVHFAGSMPGVLLAMHTLARMPARATIAVGTAIVSAGLVIIAVAPTWPVFLIGVFVVGFGFGGLVLALNQLVAYSEGRRRAALLNALNAAYSLGAVISPLLVAALAANNFSALYLAGAAVWLVLVAGAAQIRGRLPVTADVPGRPSALVLVFVAGIVLYVGLENAIGGWMASHLQSTGLSATAAATLTSAFWLALVTGRMLMILVPSRVSEAGIVLVAAACAALALLLAIEPALAPVGYVIAGLAIAPIFPTAVVWLAKRSPGDSRASAWVFPAAAIGGTFGPGLIGVVIAGAGIAWAPAVLAVVAIAMVATFAAAARRSAA
jgi:MFS transporter, FHS family, glucose/mannose:H+ symporter